MCALLLNLLELLGPQCPLSKCVTPAGRLCIRRSPPVVAGSLLSKSSSVHSRKQWPGRTRPARNGAAGGPMENMMRTGSLEAAGSCAQTCKPHTPCLPGGFGCASVRVRRVPSAPSLKPTRPP